MIDEKQKAYPAPMLPNVDYQQFDSFFTSLVDVEYTALENLKDFLSQLEDILLEKSMMLVPELVIAHCSAYLGLFSTMCNVDEAKRLEKPINQLITQHANLAYSKFNQYPVNSTVSTQHEKQENLIQLRQDSPGSIVPQTMRLGRIVMTLMESLQTPRVSKQKELFCPHDDFFGFTVPLASDQRKQWLEMLRNKSINHAINQLAIQIAWLIGYFSHLDKKPPIEGQYLEYALPCMSMYQDYTLKFIGSIVLIEFS